MRGIGIRRVIPWGGWRLLMMGIGSITLAASIVLMLLLPESHAFVTARAAPGRSCGVRLSHRPSANPAWRCGSGRAVAPALSDKDVRDRSGRHVDLSRRIHARLLAADPASLMNAGATISAAGVIAACGKLGGIVGAILIGWLMDRKGIPGARSLLRLLRDVAADPPVADPHGRGGGRGRAGRIVHDEWRLRRIAGADRHFLSGCAAGDRLWLDFGSFTFLRGWRRCARRRCLLGAGYGAGVVCNGDAACMMIGCGAIGLLGWQRRDTARIADPILSAA